jgi:ribosome silencing factor RsfS/YbeB/iojap
MGVSDRPGEPSFGNGPEAGRRRRKPIARKPAPPTTPGPKDPKRRAPQPPVALKEAAKAPGTPRKKAVAAGPRGKREEPADISMLDRLQTVIVSSLEGDKAEQVVALDLAGRASFADRMVIATGLADRQITAMASHLEQKLAESGVKRVRIEGAGGSDWVLIDAGDIVIHLFKPEARSLYALEKMWGAEFDEPAVQSM